MTIGEKILEEVSGRTATVRPVRNRGDRWLIWVAVLMGWFLFVAFIYWMKS